MAETLTCTVGNSLAFTQTSDIDIGERQYTGSTRASYTLANGTGLNQANQLYTDTRTIAASGTDDLDLAGSLVNAFGATITFTKIKYLKIQADSANTNNVIVGGAAANPLLSPFGNVNDLVNVRPGGALILEAPDATAYAVAAGSADTLRMTNSAGSTSVTYTITIVGVV